MSSLLSLIPDTKKDPSPQLNILGLRKGSIDPFCVTDTGGGRTPLPANSRQLNPNGYTNPPSQLNTAGLKKFILIQYGIVTLPEQVNIAQLKGLYYFCLQQK